MVVKNTYNIKNFYQKITIIVEFTYKKRIPAKHFSKTIFLVTISLVFQKVKVINH